jgi:hypothetical protein
MGWVRRAQRAVKCSEEEKSFKGSKEKEKKQKLQWI